MNFWNPGTARCISLCADVPFRSSDSGAESAATYPEACNFPELLSAMQGGKAVAYPRSVWHVTACGRGPQLLWLYCQCWRPSLQTQVQVNFAAKPQTD